MLKSSFKIKRIFNLCNSKIGLQGNIGMRTSHIIKALEEENKIECISISRSVLIKNRNSYTYGLLKNIPSFLNYLRVNFFKKFNHKYYDILLFEFIVINYLKLLKLRQGEIIHLWEISPKIIKFVKKNKCKIILDVPIAPHKYRRKIEKELATKFTQAQNNKIISDEKFCFNNVDVIIAPSEFVKNEILDYGVNPGKIKVVSFGVNVDNIKKDFNKIGRNLNFCIAGALTKRKGIKYLLKAWDSGNFNNDKLHLCGKISPDLKKIINTMSNKKNIIMPGFIDTYNYFKKCDVYVFPSLMEGSSKSIYEAMNRSLPIICTYESGSIITDKKEGFIIEKMDSKPIIEKMLFFKKNKDQIMEMGFRSKETVKNFSWDFYSKNVIEIYKGL
tara:strand:- start:3362 stop:4522 length:1161 start_codon:yes stop_codon:yes gene_type:complete